MIGAWSADELERIDGSDEIELASLKEDGTLGKPVVVWVARVGDALYVRSYRGRESVWYGRARSRGRGRLQAAGVARDILFLDPEEGVVHEIDAAFRAKYRRYGRSYVDAMASRPAQEATLKLMPASG